MKKAGIFFLLFISYAIAVPAQGISKVQEPFHLAFINYTLINPAFSKENNPMLLAGNQSGLGPYSSIRSFYILGKTSISSEGKSNSHHVGVSFLTEQEGSFINRHRINLIYSWTTKLAKDAEISAGIAGGIANAVLQSTTSFAGGSDVAPDLSSGISLRVKKLDLAFSGNQLTNSKLAPIQGEIELSRHFNFYMGYEMELSHFLTLDLMNNLLLAGDNNRNYTAGQIRIHEIFSAGAGYFFNRGFNITAGFPQIKVKQHILAVFGSYFFSTGAIQSALFRSAELGIKYSFITTERKPNK